MAMIKCKECGKEISDKADFCPHCGFTYKKKHTILKTGLICICTIILITVLIIIVALIPGLINKIKVNNAIKEIAGTYEVVSSKNVQLGQKFTFERDKFDNVCTSGSYPPNYAKTPYLVYLKDGNKYVITQSTTIGIQGPTKIFFFKYENDKLTLDTSINNIECEYFSSEESKIEEDIQIEYKRK